MAQRAIPDEAGKGCTCRETSICMCIHMCMYKCCYNMYMYMCMLAHRGTARPVIAHVDESSRKAQ